MNLNLRGKIAVAVIMTAFIILAAVYVVFRYITYNDNAAAALASSTETVGESEVRAETADVTETDEDRDINESKVDLFTDEDKLCFEKSEYSTTMLSSVLVELNIKDSSIAASSLTWKLNDEDAGEIKVDDDGTKATVTLKKAGSFEFSAVSPTGLYCVCQLISAAPDEYLIEDVPFISQNELYPSGCESISATMLLNYYNYDISPDVFIDGYLHMDYLRASDDGTEVVGPDPYTAFIGTPYDINSLGCYPPVIVEAFNKVFKETGSENEAVDTTGMSLEELADKYLVQDQPVLVWSTMYLWEPFETEVWKVQGAAEYSPYNDGDIYAWIANEHCLVFIGYDEYYYYFNDPLYYEGTIRYEKDAFNVRFEQIGKGSVAINGGVPEKEISVEMPAEDTNGE